MSDELSYELAYLRMKREYEQTNQMLQDKNTYIIEKHLTKDYAKWKTEHDKKNATL